MAVNSDNPAPEVSFRYRRIYTYAVTLINSGLLVGILSRLNDPKALMWLGVSLVAANVVMATLYMAGASVVDWAQLAAGWRSGTAPKDDPPQET